MLGRITRAYRGARVIVSDDGSSDGTREKVRRFAARDMNVSLLDRSLAKSAPGLTASVIDAIEASRTRFVIVMDSDGQHPPEKIREIARRLEGGSKLVVATRAEVTEWALYRKVISKSLMYLGRIVLAARGGETCGDIFSGFFGVDRKFFLGVLGRNRRRFIGRGYKVLFDFLKCVGRGTIEVSDVPYVFRTRNFGLSKAGVSQVVALLESFAT
jgi:dolichol-phosphate mannosyltransferase